MIKPHKLEDARALRRAVQFQCSAYQLTEFDQETVSGLAEALHNADNEQDANDGHFSDGGKTGIKARMFLAGLVDPALAAPDLAPSLAAVLEIIERIGGIWNISATVKLARENLALAQGVAAFDAGLSSPENCECPFTDPALRTAWNSGQSVARINGRAAK